MNKGMVVVWSLSLTGCLVFWAGVYLLLAALFGGN